MAYVIHFKVVLLMCFVSLDSAGGYLLGKIQEYAGRGNVITEVGVERISVWAWLFGVMMQ